MFTFLGQAPVSAWRVRLGLAMRVLVFVLVMLAAAKIGVQEYVVATAKSEIIISAYRDRAVGACGEAARTRHIVVEPKWSHASQVRLVIGKSGLDVGLWQFDHELWPARFKHPYLFITMRDEPRKVFCEFDVVAGSASVFQL